MPALSSASVNTLGTLVKQHRQRRIQSKGPNNAVLMRLPTSTQNETEVDSSARIKTSQSHSRFPDVKQPNRCLGVPCLSALRIPHQPRPTHTYSRSSFHPPPSQQRLRYVTPHLPRGEFVDLSAVHAERSVPPLGDGVLFPQLALLAVVPER